MPTKNQLGRKFKTRVIIKKKGTRSRALRGRPQRRGICYKIRVMKPKKPNSAQRKIAKLFVHRPKKNLTCYIPGRGGFELRNYSRVLVRGGRVCDLPGVQYHLIRGKLDLTWVEREPRKYARSKYGIPKDQSQTFHR